MDFGDILRVVTGGAGAADDVARVTSELQTIISRHYPNFQASDLDAIARRTDISDDLGRVLSDEKNITTFKAAHAALDGFDGLIRSAADDDALRVQYEALRETFRTTANLGDDAIARLDGEFDAFIAYRGERLAAREGAGMTREDALESWASRGQQRAALREQAAAADATPTPTHPAAAADEAATVTDDAGEAVSEAAADTTQTRPPFGPNPDGRVLPDDAAVPPTRAAAEPTLNGSTLYSNPFPAIGSALRGAMQSPIVRNSWNYTAGIWVNPVASFVVDSAKFLRRAHQYARMGVSYRYNDYIRSKDLFAAVDNLKETNAAGFAIDVNPNASNVSKSNFTYEDLATGQPSRNLVGAVGDAGGSLRNVNASAAAHVDELTDALDTASRSLNGAVESLQEAQRLEARISTITRRAQFYERAAMEPPANIKSNIEEHLRAAQDAGDDAAEAIYKSAADSLDAGRPSSVVLEQLSSDLAAHGEAISGGVRTTMAEAMRVVEANRVTLQQLNGFDALDAFVEAADNLGRNVEGLNARLDAINSLPPMKSGDAMDGGTVVARLMAHDVAPHLRRLTGFQEELSSVADDVSARFDLSDTLAGFGNINGTNTDALIGDITALSDTLVARATTLRESGLDRVNTALTRLDGAEEALDNISTITNRYTYETRSINSDIFARRGELNSAGTPNTNFALELGVGLVEREATRADRARFRELFNNGEIELYVAPGRTDAGITANQLIRYQPGEDAWNSASRNSNSNHIFRTENQRRLEYALVSGATDTAKEIAAKMIVEADGEARILEAVKWSALSYARHVDADGIVIRTGDTSLNRREGTGDFIHGFMEAIRKRDAGLAQSSNETNLFSDEFVKKLQHVSETIFATGANAQRMGWRDMWDRHRYLRFAGDRANEHSSNFDRANVSRWENDFGPTGRMGMSPMARLGIAFNPLGGHSDWRLRILPINFENGAFWRGIVREVPYRQTHFGDAPTTRMTIIREGMRWGSGAALAGTIYGWATGGNNSWYNPFGWGGGSNAPANTSAAAVSNVTTQQAQAMSGQMLQAFRADYQSGASRLQLVSGYEDPNTNRGVISQLNNIVQVQVGIINGKMNALPANDPQRAQYAQLLTQLNDAAAEFTGPRGKFATDLQLMQDSINQHTLAELERIDRELNNVDATGAPLSTPAPTDAEAQQLLLEQEALVQDMVTSQQALVAARSAQIHTIFVDDFKDAINNVQPFTSSPTPGAVNVPLPGNIVVASNTTVQPAQDAVEAVANASATDAEIVRIAARGAPVQSLIEAMGISSRTMTSAGDTVSEGITAALTEANHVDQGVVPVLMAQIDAKIAEGGDVEKYEAIKEQIGEFAYTYRINLGQTNDAYMSSGAAIMDYMGGLRSQIREGMELTEADAVLDQQHVAYEATVAMTENYQNAVRAQRDTLDGHITTFLTAIEAGEPLTTLPQITPVAFQAPDLDALSSGATVDVAASDAAAAVVPVAGVGPQGVTDPVVQPAADSGSTAQLETLMSASRRAVGEVQQKRAELVTFLAQREADLRTAEASASSTAPRTAAIADLRVQLNSDNNPLQLVDNNIVAYQSTVARINDTINRQTRDLGSNDPVVRQQAEAQVTHQLTLLVQENERFLASETSRIDTYTTGFDTRVEAFNGRFANDTNIVLGTADAAAAASQQAAPVARQPVVSAGSSDDTTRTQVPQWQRDLEEIKRQASAEITNAGNAANAVAEDISNSTDEVDSLADYVRQSNVIIDRGRTLIQELRTSTDGASSDRQQGISNLERMINTVEGNRDTISGYVSGLESKSEHIQNHLDEAQRLESEIRNLNGQGSVARARQLLTQLEGVQQEIQDHARQALDQYSTPAFNAYRENVAISSGDSANNRPGNSEFNYRYGNDQRINRGIEALGGGRNSPLYDLFGTTRPGQSSYFGDVVGGVTSWFNRAGQQWRQGMLNAPDKSTANMYIWTEFAAKSLAGLAVFNFINDKFLGGKVSGVAKLAVVAAIGLYFLRQTGELGDRWAARRGGSNPYAVGQGSSDNVIRTGATGSSSPASPRSGADAAGSNVYNFPVRDRNGNADNHVFVDAEGNITAQPHGGGNLVFGPRAEESIRDAVDTRVASTVNKLSGQGQHIPEIVNGQVEVIFRHPGDQPGDDPRQSVMVDFSEDREDALRIAQTANAG